MRSLALKQFLFSSLLFIMIFFLFFISRLRETERLSREILSRDTEIRAVQLEKYFDEFYQGILNILFILEKQDGLLNEGNRDEAREILRSIENSNTKSIKMVYLISREGEVVTGKQGLYDAMGHERIDVLGQTDFSSYQSLTVTDPYFTPLSGYTLAFIYPVRDRQNRVTGLTMVELNLYELGEYIRTGSDKSTTVILNREGVTLSFDVSNRLAPAEKRIYPFVIDDGLADLLDGQRSGESLISYGDKEFILFKSLLDRFQWQLCILLDRGLYEEEMARSRRDMLALGGLLLLGLLMGSFLLSLYFAQPIHNLALFMNQTDDFSPPPLPDIRRRDEIGFLYQSYDNLIGRIGNLAEELKRGEEEKRLYEIGMLQNQITPHFLLNTLACVRSLARQGKGEDVSHAVKHLIGLLSYRLENQGGEVTLVDEVASVRAYLEIQKIRYPRLCTVSIDLPVDLERTKVIPLILQPIVENALFKGLLPRGKKGALRILCRKRENRLVVYVGDNGVGMAPEIRDSLLAGAAHSKTGDASSPGHAIGVANVHQRIRLQYGPEWGLSLFSREGIGTVVGFFLPLIGYPFGK